MGNSIALAESYLPILDEVYKRGSLTSILDSANNRVKFLHGNKVELFKTSMQGLGDYSRNSGYVSGDVTCTWEPLTLACDRGRSFLVDEMDDEETINMAFGTLVPEFVRTKVTPEIDAYRFAKFSSAVTPIKADITVGTTDCVALVDTAIQTMGDAEVPVEGRIMFVSEKFYNGIKAKITRVLANENGYNREIEMLNGMPIIRVPQNRFNTAIELLDGTSQGEAGGGYTNVPTSGSSYAINFMIVHPSAVIQVAKHVLPRIFDPQTTQTANAWKFDYRIYHDAFVEANKTAGIYVHCANTANS